MKHTVKLADFDDFKPMIRICGSHGDGENKSIDMIVHPNSRLITFRIINKKKKGEYTAINLSEAITLYNNM